MIYDDKRLLCRSVSDPVFAAKGKNEWVRQCLYQVNIHVSLRSSHNFKIISYVS